MTYINTIAEIKLGRDIEKGSAFNFHQTFLTYAPSADHRNKLNKLGKLTCSQKRDGKIVEYWKAHVKEWCKENLQAVPKFSFTNVKNRHGKYTVTYFMTFEDDCDAMMFSLMWS